MRHVHLTIVDVEKGCVTYSVYVCVALDIRRAMDMRRIVSLSVAYLVLPKGCVTFSVYVFVALVIRRAMGMRHIVSLSVAYLVLP
jgi:hypothetical protein